MTKDAKSIGQDGDRLDSWKEIAAYLGKDVRTALRWSKDEGMPVYRHAGSKHGAIYAYRSEIDEWIHSDRSKPTRTYTKPAFLWTGAITTLALLAAAVLLWLTLFSDQPDTLVGERPWVLITDFDNRSGESRFDGLVETALRRELANSHHVLVVAPERIRDTLILMKIAPDAAIDAELGREICLRYEANCALLTGRVEKFGSNYLLSLEVVAPSDGHTVASAEEEAAGDSRVLPAVHNLCDWLREYLGEELGQIKLGDEQLEKVTTPSLRALELYSRGIQLAHLGRPIEAEVLFRQAVAEDPQFASANLFVFWALENQGKGSEEEALSFLKRAMELADSTGEQERYFIEGTYYDLFERDYEKACNSYRSLAELFPDHFFAAGNTAMVCGGKLGLREEYIRYFALVAEQRPGPSWTGIAAAALTLLEKDFDRARPFVERLRGFIEDGEISANLAVGEEIAFTELFLAEEYLDKGMLQDVVDELKRLEQAMGSMESSWRSWVAWKLSHFYLALGQIQKSKALVQDSWYTGMFPAWCAFLVGDQVAFGEHAEHLRSDLQETLPGPNERLLELLGWNMGWSMDWFPLDVLVPLFNPESAMERASAVAEPLPEFFSLPRFETKMQLANGHQLFAHGRQDEGIALLRSSVVWFRDRGSWVTFPYYFLGVELLATALVKQGDLTAAYRVLEDAAGQGNMVNSMTAPQHQKIQARLVLLARELGHSVLAEGIEAELAEALRFADQEHPILVQIRKQQEELMETK